MSLAELSTVEPSLDALSLVISRVTRARTVHALALALADPALSTLLSFDRCRLLLPTGERREEETDAPASAPETATPTASVNAATERATVAGAQANATASASAASTAWRALAASTGSSLVSSDFFALLPAPLVAALAQRASILNEADLRGAETLCGRDARAALVLRLDCDEQLVGALCFISASHDGFTEEDARRLSWLADAAAATLQNCRHLERLEAAEEARRELERLTSAFAGTLVRDVRLPLTNVLGLLELFESKLQAREPFDMEDRQLLSVALEQSERMRRLLDDMLEVARQPERPLTLDAVQVETRGLLEDAIEPLRAEAALRAIELNVSVGGDTSELFVDVRQTRRAVCYLLSAALSATPDGGRIQLEARSITGTRLGDEGQRFVVINVNDSSPGLPPEELPFVFDAFWQVSGTLRSGGRGLGLAVAKRIAAAHGGNVAVRSQRGAGTTYSIVLPAAGSRLGNAPHAPHVLVVDDAPELLLLLGKLIERMGYQVTTAPSVAHALEVFRERAVDLLITDWAMPEANGGDLICALRSKPKWHKLPIIVLTGHDTDIERGEAHAAGCDRFLVKPVMRHELQQAISELLPQRAFAH